jgi:hypothetical protein
MVHVYEIAQMNISKIKNILDAEDKKDPKNPAKWIINEFKTQGYILRDSRAVGKSTEAHYLYIKADDEFFKRNEKALLDAGAKLLKGKEAAEVQKKIEDLENAAIEGLGGIFG